VALLAAFHQFTTGTYVGGDEGNICAEGFQGDEGQAFADAGKYHDVDFG
jgi:hypothetical protein